MKKQYYKFQIGSSHIIWKPIGNNMTTQELLTMEAQVLADLRRRHNQGDNQAAQVLLEHIRLARMRPPAPPPKTSRILRGDASLCEHANECPAQCHCPADCYCRVEGSCHKIWPSVIAEDSCR